MYNLNLNPALTPIRPFNYCDKLNLLILDLKNEIMGIRIEILELQAQLHDAPPPPKEDIIQQIKELRELLRIKNIELAKPPSIFSDVIEIIFLITDCKSDTPSIVSVSS